MSGNNTQENVGDVPPTNQDGNQSQTPLLPMITMITETNLFLLVWNEIVPDVLGRHLLRSQYLINRLAAEQDLHLDDLEVEVESLRGEQESFRAQLNHFSAEMNYLRNRMDRYDRLGEDVLGLGRGFVVFIPRLDPFPVTLIIICSVCVAYIAWIAGRWFI
ncbi:hypothetical protein FHETE_8487 [Fusarium heterosporum]|uniref:Uncharacterized protein n=1 Tax=Fusarium heterosporum TaxID=42747 RepID=A0A8H5T2K8_FUSHE|nr:hypothetical protein FHETE_8487 [Fusarium heterosporum]